jgi:hypothetical protein
MRPALRKLNLTAHITSSVGWLGSAAAFLALAVINLTSQDAQIVRAAYLSMELIGWVVIVPLSIASLLTGLVQSLGTRWGLFRHYWVLLKFLITVFSTIVLLMFMQSLSKSAGAAAGPALSLADLAGLRRPAAFRHSGVGLLLLVAATVLSVFKPWGLTRYGRRKQRERQAPDSDKVASENGPSLGLDISIAVLAVTMLFFLVQHFIGSGHGHHGR